MKKVLFFIVISLWTLTHISGQEFGSPDSEWVYNYTGGSQGVTKVIYSRDTLIGRRLVHVFKKEAYRYSTRRDSFVYFPEPIYIYSKDGIVEFSTDKINFDTLHNFKAKIGQSWMIYRHDRLLSDSMKLTILDTFRILISNNYMLAQKVEYTFLNPPGSGSFIDTVFEYIGSRWIYINPFDENDRARDDGEGGFLRCFKNDDLGVVEFYSKYQSEYEYNCDNLTSISTPKTGEKFFSVSPNPVINELYVESKHPDISSLKIVDIIGHVLHTADILPGRNTLDMSWMPSGYYMIVINGEMVGKVVK